MRRTWLVLALIPVALGFLGYLVLWYTPAVEPPSLSSHVVEATLRVGERQRSYLAYVPSELAPGAPLVLVLHGSLMDGAMMRVWTGYGFERLAEQRRFAVLYPEGYRGNWNDCRKHAPYPAKTENVEDVAFMEALIEQFVSAHHIDRRRVFVFGYSNGAQMALRLALEAHSTVAAVAAVATNLPAAENDSCSRKGKTSPVMLIGGSDDPLAPFAGGDATMFGFRSRGRVLSADASAEQLALRNGLRGPVIRRLPHVSNEDPTRVEERVWSDGARPYLVQYRVLGGGHVVPQPAFRYPRLLGRTTLDLDAPAEALRFFFAIDGEAPR